LFLNLEFFCVCLFCTLFICPPPLPVDFFGSHFCFFFLSLFCQFYYCKLANTKLHTDQGERDGNHPPSKNKLVQDSEGNEENGHPDTNSNKTKINYAQEPKKKSHKRNLKEEILKVITERFMEMLLDMVNQNVQEAFKKFQDNKNKEYEKTQKQMNS
jgi:hypothetical protein